MGTQLDVLRFLFLWHCLCGWLPPPEWQPDESRGSTTLSFRTFGSSRAARVWNRLVVSTFQNLDVCRKEVCMLISPMTFILFWKGLKVKHQPSSFEILFVHWQEDRPEKCESELSLQSDVQKYSWWDLVESFKTISYRSYRLMVYFLSIDGGGIYNYILSIYIYCMYIPSFKPSF